MTSYCRLESEYSYDDTDDGGIEPRPGNHLPDAMRTAAPPSGYVDEGRVAPDHVVDTHINQRGPPTSVPHDHEDYSDYNGERRGPPMDGPRSPPHMHDRASHEVQQPPQPPPEAPRPPQQYDVAVPGRPYKQMLFIQ